MDDSVRSRFENVKTLKSLSGWRQRRMMGLERLERSYFQESVQKSWTQRSKVIFKKFNLKSFYSFCHSTLAWLKHKGTLSIITVPIHIHSHRCQNSRRQWRLRVM
jgi:hypothetical protein